MYRIAFVGGGTAGHIMPNLAVISALKDEFECVYLGCADGMEKPLCERRGIPFYAIDAVKLRRDKVLANFAVPFKLRSCIKTAEKVLNTVRPDLIFSKGGYVSLPAVLAAKDIPVIAHESDFTPGLCTKLSKRKATRILCAFEACAARMKNAEHVGTPLDPALYSGMRKRAAYGANGQKPIVAVVGGSSGAAAINNCTVQALTKLTQCFHVIHVTGKGKKTCERQNGYFPVQFENNMPDLYATCDIIVTRGGANALSEVVALKIPALCIPLEKASRGDQIQNAEYFEKKGAVKVLREHAMTPDSLVGAVTELYNTRDKYIRAMSNIDVDGTKKICEIIRQTLNK